MCSSLGERSITDLSCCRGCRLLGSLHCHPFPQHLDQLREVFSQPALCAALDGGSNEVVDRAHEDERVHDGQFCLVSPRGQPACTSLTKAETEDGSTGTAAKALHCFHALKRHQAVHAHTRVL